jgi:hypothetical protein
MVSSHTHIAKSLCHHTGELMAARKKGLGVAVSNWNQPMPLPEKIYKAIRNLTTRVVKRQTCCGHDSEPGC